MKIERLTENSIRCTLNRADLDSRDLKLGELAYGTEKAKNLFKDMIAQASYECGFEAEDIPLMIEAIPVSADCIILVITKVEDPEELDTRFSKFAPSEDVDTEEYDDSEDEQDPMTALNLSGSLPKGAGKSVDSEDDFIPFSSKEEIRSNKASGLSPDTENSAKSDSSDNEPVIIERVFSFPDYATISSACSAVTAGFKGNSTIYKDTKKGNYVLFLDNSGMAPDLFTGICNVLSEYGRKEKFTYATHSYLQEHCEILIKRDAVNIISSL